LSQQLLNPQIQENRRIFQKTVEKASEALTKNHLEAVMAWSKIAAHFAFVRHPGVYMSPKLESLLLEVAQRVEADPPEVTGAFFLKTKPKNFGKMRLLHVLTESYGSGGHTPFVARWISNTLENSVHSIITTAQNGELPPLLWDAVGSCGGWTCSLSELSDSLVEQSLLLRLLAQNWADIIVLLVHPFDPVPSVAFGVDGGPPVIFCNHADHAFWLGSSVADITVDYHSSAGLLNAKRRGIIDSRLLPIPLTRNDSAPIRSSVRQQLGFGDKDVIMLTVGRAEKFYPFGNYDFLNVMVDFLKSHSNVRLVAAGPSSEGRWQEASQQVEGRIQALGVVDRDMLENFYAAADVYVVSFPCGSGTSMLEAAMHNLPIVGLHLKELPHLSLEDDVGFANFKVHKSSLEGFTETLEWAADYSHLERERAIAGLVRENIEHEHCPPGWNTYLNAVLQSLPSQHALHSPMVPLEQTDYTDVYWEYLSSQMLSNELPEYTLARLIRVYGKYLPRTEAIGAQAKNLMSAFTKIDSLRRGRQFIGNFKESVASAFS
jgi:hypothetical protein